MLLSEFIHSLDRKIIPVWAFVADNKVGKTYERVYSQKDAAGDSRFLCIKIIGDPLFNPMLENKVFGVIDSDLPRMKKPNNALTVRVPQSPTPMASAEFSKASSFEDLLTLAPAPKEKKEKDFSVSRDLGILK